MRSSVFTVSEIVRTLKTKIDMDSMLQKILIQGEISNFTAHRSGHWYFTLKDAGSRIACVMFASYAARCGFRPKDGMKVLIQANTSIYEASGQLQLYVLAMKPDGIGDLYLRFEQLKRKLYEQGYFDQSHKKPLPVYPFRIGLITGKDTAARQDVLTTIKRRWPVCFVLEKPVLVQGEEAAAQMIAALRLLDEQHLDVIILARGGGSIEDLWAFNDERLALAVYAAKTPIISGVGHEVDTTIVDYVSDRRAPTPTGAAEIATPDLREVLLQLDQKENRMKQAMTAQLLSCRQKLDTLTSARVIAYPKSLTENKRMRLDVLQNRLRTAVRRLSEPKEHLISARARLIKWADEVMLRRRHELLIRRNELIQKTEVALEDRRHHFDRSIQLLDAYSPLKSLSRGYSLVSDEQQRLVTRVDSVEINEMIKIRLSDGTLKAQVVDKEKNHE